MALETNSELCEACRSAPVERIVNDHDPEQPYRVCAECAHRLDSRSLRPLEWFNLASIHGSYKHLLHSDFYDQRGVADQPSEEVVTPELFPAPKLAEVKGDLVRLVDYAMTRYWLEDNVIVALRKQNPTQLLHELQRRMETHHNAEIEDLAYDVCAEVLGNFAADWIRERMPNVEHWYGSLSQAIANCLPHEEGFPWLVHKLETLSREDLAELQKVYMDYAQVSICLAWFRSPKTLDWMETQTGRMVNSWRHVSEQWGQLAALSDFSWERAVKWLELGRPLSLVALDALKDMCRFDTGLLKKLAPRLKGPAQEGEIRAKLTEYAQKDSVPRVERDVQFLIGCIDVLSS